MRIGNMDFMVEKCLSKGHFSFGKKGMLGNPGCMRISLQGYFGWVEERGS